MGTASRSVRLLAFVLFLVLPSRPMAALTIVLTDTGGVGVGTQARNGFEQASALWSSVISDPVTVRLDVGFQALAPGILGQAGSNSVSASYVSVQTALFADQTSSDDALAFSNLPAGSALSFLTNDSSGAVVLDNDGSTNNLFLDVNRANAKALNLLLDDGNADAAITFNSDFAFDFDPSNGILGSAFDFVGIAVHEIGHALGFVSGVDAVDFFSGPNGGGAPLDLNPFRVFSVLDLFRYSSASVATGVDILDLAYGGTPFFSIDGGATNLGLFSTGSDNGDGRQASHWKDNLGLGILDPTVGQGELLSLSGLDTTAFDVIGWNLVPEPSIALLFVVGFAAFLTVGKTEQRDRAS